MNVEKEGIAPFALSAVTDQYHQKSEIL